MLRVIVAKSKQKPKMGNETRITKSESNQRCEENEMGNRKPGAKSEDDGVPGETIETMRARHDENSKSIDHITTILGRAVNRTTPIWGKNGTGIFNNNNKKTISLEGEEHAPTKSLILRLFYHLAKR